MKQIIFSLSFLFFTQSFAQEISCYSISSLPDQTMARMTGFISVGDSIDLLLQKNEDLTFTKITVSDIKSDQNSMLISGYAKDLIYIGGRPMRISLQIPFMKSNLSFLETVTPTSELESQVEKIPLHCSVDIQYRILPISLEK